MSDVFKPVWGGAILALLFLAGCGGGDLGSASSSTGASASSGGSSSGSVTDEVVGGNIATLSLSSDAATFDASDVSSGENIVVMLYSYNQGSTIEGFGVSGDEVSQQFLGTNDEAATTEDAEAAVAEIEGNADVTEEFHNRLREVEAELIDDDAIPAAPSPNSMRYATTSSQREFRVLNSFATADTYDTVTATLRYSNDTFEFYVDDRDAASLSDDDLATLATNFLAAIPDERGLFGTESDVNGDEKFAVLFTRTVNSLGASSGGIVTGFFYAVDLFEQAQYAMSNEMEVYYTFVPDPSGDYGPTISTSFALSNILPGVLPHEYQHMISFNRHYFENGGSAEAGWLNEGLSHLAEDIYSADANGYMASTGLENPARVASYLGNIANICFSCGTALNQRGGSYLFLRYLYEQAEGGALSGPADGADFIARVLDTNQRSITNVTHAAFGEDGTEDDFKNILGKFGLAIYLSNTGLSSDPRFAFDGINLRTVQEDNRGTSLSGPAIQTVSSLPFTDTLTGNGLTFLSISGDTLLAAGGQLTFSFDSGASFGGYIIRE